MSLKEQIDQDIKQAMLQKRKQELITLRAIKSAILMAETEKGAGDQLAADVEMKILAKQAKQRKESADIFLKEGRNDLADKELFELDIINNYLPKQMTEEEVTVEIKKIIAEVGASGPQDMGKVMGKASKEMSGKADGKMISEIVKTLLNS
jgi:uncharacterized protein YqeY